MSSSFLFIHTHTNQKFCEGDQDPEKLALIHFECLVLLLELAFIVPERIPFFNGKTDERNHKPIRAAYQQIWVTSEELDAAVLY